MGLACLALTLAGLGCVAAPDARICLPAEPSPCDDGRTCVAGRCALGDNAMADANRYVVSPLDVAVVGSSGYAEPGGGADLPSAVALGRGTTVLLMRFEPSWREDADVVRAFVVLDPVDGGMPGRDLVTFEAARIREPWDPAVVSWGRQPRLDVAFQAGSLRPRSTVPLRVDVTPVVRAWIRRGGRAGDDHGIAVLAHGARGDDAFGSIIATGAARGAGPRLEVYAR